MSQQGNRDQFSGMLEDPLGIEASKPADKPETKIPPKKEMDPAVQAVNRKNNKAARDRKKKDMSQQDAVDNLAKDNIALQEKVAMQECDIELRDSQIIKLTNQLAGQNSEKSAIITVAANGKADFELEGKWVIQDVKRLIRPMMVAVRRGITGASENPEDRQITSERAEDLQRFNKEIDEGIRMPDGKLVKTD